MRNETARREIEALDYYLQNHTNDYSEESHMAMMMAIKALEQEPCEDAVSRQAAIDTFGLSEKTRKYGGDHSGYDTIMLYEVQDALEALPSVNPQKIGNWIFDKGRRFDIMEIIDIKDVCFNNQCICCPLYVEDESECILEHAPITWDLEEIERRLKNYGKEEKS